MGGEAGGRTGPACAESLELFELLCAGAGACARELPRAFGARVEVCGCRVGVLNLYPRAGPAQTLAASERVDERLTQSRGSE